MPRRRLHRRRLPLVALLAPLTLLWLLALPTRASAQQLQIAVKPQFRAGEKIAVTVTSPVAAARFDLALDHAGKPVQVAHGPSRAGEHVALVLPGPGHYEGKLVVTFRDGNRSSTDLTFDAVVAGSAMTMGYTREHLDLAAHTIEFTLSRPAGKAELTVVDDSGKEIATSSATFNGDKPGTWLRMHWTPTSAGNVLKLEIVATSADGTSTTRATLLPWQVAVPHEEVVFETGKADIRPSEEPKLDASYKKITDEIARARKADANLQVKLFVSGHTDTVGSSADNRKLSLARARAIGTWFRDRGLPLPISVAGFGEDAPKVKTPDETDNAANRRADYILAVEEPVIARGVHATWMKLQ